jgi:uncharacterized membrane protein
MDTLKDLISNEIDKVVDEKIARIGTKAANHIIQRFTDKSERNCHIPAPRGKCMTHRHPLTTAAKIIHTTVQLCLTLCYALVIVVCIWCNILLKSVFLCMTLCEMG